MKIHLKSQSSVEFVILASFMIVVILGFFAVTSSRVLDAREEGNRKIAQDIAEIAYSEIELAKSVSDGYTRVFTMPRKIGDVSYNLTIIDNRELIVNYLGYEYIKFLPANVSGNLSTGLNEIKKINGILYLNLIRSRCENGKDDDGDTLIDSADPGCYLGCDYLASNKFNPDFSEADNCDCNYIGVCCNGLGLGNHYSVFDNTCTSGQCWSNCLFFPPLIMRNNLLNAISFLNDGNVILRGTLQQNTDPQQASDDEFVFKDRNGNNVAIVNLITGNMVIKGNLLENQSTLTPPTSSDDFIVKNSNGDIISYIDDAGNFLLNGSLTQNGNP